MWPKIFILVWHEKRVNLKHKRKHFSSGMLNSTINLEMIEYKQTHSNNLSVYIMFVCSYAFPSVNRTNSRWPKERNLQCVWHKAILRKWCYTDSETLFMVLTFSLNFILSVRCSFNFSTAWKTTVWINFLKKTKI